MADRTYEYVVIGSGAGGGPVAYVLAHNGKKVLVLEAGPCHLDFLDDPNQQPTPRFSNDELKIEHRNFIEVQATVEPRTWRTSEADGDRTYTGDVNTLTEFFDESAVWHLPGRSSMANDYQGREATLAYFGQLGQETGGTFRANLEHVLADDEDRVIGMQRSTAERDGKRLDVGNCIVFQLKDGRIVDGREHFHDLYAWDQFWA